MKELVEEIYHHNDCDIPLEYFVDADVSIKEQNEIMKSDWYIQWRNEYHKVI